MRIEDRRPGSDPWRGQELLTAWVEDRRLGVTPGEDRSCSDAPAPGLGLGPLAAGGGQPGHANQRRWDIVEMLFCMHIAQSSFL